jgi:hypothetical protein
MGWSLSRRSAAASLPGDGDAVASSVGEASAIVPADRPQVDVYARQSPPRIRLEVRHGGRKNERLVMPAINRHNGSTAKSIRIVTPACRADSLVARAEDEIPSRQFARAQQVARQLPRVNHSPPPPPLLPPSPPLPPLADWPAASSPWRRRRGRVVIVVVGCRSHGGRRVAPARTRIGRRRKPGHAGRSGQRRRPGRVGER